MFIKPAPQIFYASNQSFACSHLSVNNVFNTYIDNNVKIVLTTSKTRVTPCEETVG